MLSPVEEIDKSTEAQEARSSSRERRLTEKGQEMHEQEAKKNERSFSKAYESWKELARGVRTKLKGFCSNEDLVRTQTDIKAKEALMHELYEPIRRNHTSTPDVVKKMDACVALTTEICDLIGKRLEDIDKTFNDRLEKERVRMILSKEEYGSVFGKTETETVISEHSKGSDSYSGATSTTSSKRVDAEADLAAKLEQAKAMQRIHEQQAKLSSLEHEWKIKEAQMIAEMTAKLEEERTKLQQLQAENEVKVAAARVRAYNNYDGLESLKYEADDKLQLDSQIIESQNPLNPQAESFRPQCAPPEILQNQQEVSLTQELASLFVSNRLPAPEPTVFTGNPLKFIDWKISFMALIGHKPLPAGEKMLYLKSYLAGEARKAVEGFFYRNSEDAYQGAWEILQERYGSSFVVQKAFRDKLMKWPKIAPNDPVALREFSDFLQSCAEAIPHVKGLAILNDGEENHKLLKKLPEWLVRRWGRVVVDELDRCQEYPPFAHFTRFLQREARIACNPIASPFLLTTKVTDERLPKRTKALSTNAQAKHSAGKPGTLISKPRPPCFVCNDETHGVAKCPTFATRLPDEKRAFIRENRLCFGCLRKGHTSKECKRRHTCTICGRNHPTCLHIERIEGASEMLNSDSPSAGNETKEVRNVMSHTLTRYSSATSSIVPVFVSLAEDPHSEILTYALLDTQSDSTFILGDLVSALNVKTQPVQLRLSTMTAVDTVIASKVDCGFTITKRKDGHYEMPLPFKGSSPPMLPNNKRLAEARLQHLKRKLRSNRQYHDHYTAFMEETISKGVAEPAPPST
ncbi:uncharacterized protein LOC113033320 [Astatotilapia calliptera]|uniref:uncharacterized protein LOC113033320 n=1 Tax=Astatotilapia calliptera TaxID=8154 RepID=UPI000E3FCAD5|nr:uncharacterized protein LOC113033320 [Astatotilapia calliptera]